MTEVNGKELYRIFAHDKGAETISYLVGFDGGVMLVFVVIQRIFPPTVEADLVANTEEKAAELSVLFSTLLKRFKGRSRKTEAKIKFSFMASHGPTFFEREVACPKWKEISENYTNAEAIAKLIEMANPYDVGKLIFWYGIPGTGKTFAIRALMREWRRKANFIYIMDPGAFFGDAGYMMQVLIEEAEVGGNGGRYYKRRRFSPGDEEEEDGRSKLLVLVVEDGLHILLAETRKQDGGAMGRLLNLTEGLIGQGLKVLVLVTTNEQIIDIDPAYKREGRCLQLLEFPAFSPAAASAWAKVKGFQLEGKEPVTLASLYARKSGSPVKLGKISDEIKIDGFVPSEEKP